jgi:arabinofuranosyltransferase
MSIQTPRNRWTLVVLALFLAYASAFIVQSSLTIFGERYFCLMDDAMISMTFARNIAEGHGPVWYPGADPVEGFTNPLWMLFMAMVHLLPLNERFSALVVQIVGALILAVMILAVRALARVVQPVRSDAVFGAMVLAGFCYPLVYWTLMGMEVGLLALTVTVAAILALRGLDADEVPVGFYLLSGAATLIRPDAAVIYLAGWSALAVMQRRHRTRTLVIGSGVLLLFLGGQTLARLALFGEPLPNTYYLKMTGYSAMFRILRGGLVFLRYVGAANAALIVLPFVALLIRRDRTRMFLCWLVASQWAYSMYVGGDSWESWGGANRFLSTVLPLYAVLLGDVLARMMAAIAGGLAHDDGANAVVVPRAGRALYPAAVMVALVAFNGFATGEALLLAPQFQTTLNREMVTRAVMLRTYTAPDATVAVTWAGSIPYFSRRASVDLLGKCDPIVARQDSRIPAEIDRIDEFVPGHVKYDFAHSIGALAPDVVVQIWGGGRDEMAAFVYDSYLPYRIKAGDYEAEGLVFWFRRGSDRVRWDDLPEGSAVPPPGG